MDGVEQIEGDDKAFGLVTSLEFLDFETKTIGLKVWGRIPPMAAGEYVLVRRADFDRLMQGYSAP